VDVIDPIGTINESSSIEDVVKWARGLGIDEEDALKLQNHEINGKALFLQTKSDLVLLYKLPGGPATILANEIQKLKEPHTREFMSRVPDPDVSGFLEENQLTEQFSEYKKRKMETTAQGEPTKKKIKTNEAKAIPSTTTAQRQETPQSPHSDSEDSSMSEHTNDEVVVDGKILFVLFDSGSKDNYLLKEHTLLPGFELTDDDESTTNLGAQTANLSGTGNFTFIYQNKQLTINVFITDKISLSFKQEEYHCVDLMIGKETMVMEGIISRKPILGLAFKEDQGKNLKDAVEGENTQNLE